MQAEFRHEGCEIDYTPGSAVGAGTVVLIKSIIGVPNADIAANRKGSLRVSGVVSVVKVTGAIVQGQPVYWNPTGDPVGGTAGTGAATAVPPTSGATSGFLPIGLCVDADAASGDARVLVLLAPAARRFMGGEIALDGSNPTSVTTGLSVVLSANANFKTAVALGDDPNALSIDYGGAVTAGQLDIHAWKNTNGTDPTQIASTATTTVSWTAVGY